ncbi:MAG: hypothetical protein ACJ74J_10910 [Blastocatellia bacterium]
MNETNEIKELKLQRGIDQTIGTLVEQAEKLIIDCRSKIKQIDANQIRNVMAVANSAPHPAVVTNFIYYQMGRSGKPSKAWKETKLGEAVVAVIDGQLHRLAQKAVEAASYGSVETVQVEMTRLLLGFMYRRYVYEAS